MQKCLQFLIVAATQLSSFDQLVTHKVIPGAVVLITFTDISNLRLFSAAVYLGPRQILFLSLD